MQPTENDSNTTNFTIRLTQFGKGAGCGCKLAPGFLDEILAHLPQQLPHFEKHQQPVVGFQTRDDAAVWAIDDTTALISTLDFFTPIVDDAFTFGVIAAANALSDIWAMGGKPIMALSILGWPTEKLPLSVAGEVLRGAQHTCSQAGITIAGGHSIEAPEPFFGLQVNGLAPLIYIKTNDSAQAGDLLYLTKPLGTGLITTALKRNKADAEVIAAAVETMQCLNSLGEKLGTLSAIHAMTDVTGFGLAGHLLEMCRGKELTAEIRFAALPLLPGVIELMQADIYSDGTMRNFKSYGHALEIHQKEHLYILCDPQTNGGLLLSVDPNDTQPLELAAKEMNHPLWCIGKMTNTTKGSRIIVS
jgi:selenide,water dikinase